MSCMCLQQKKEMTSTPLNSYSHWPDEHWKRKLCRKSGKHLSYTVSLEDLPARQLLARGGHSKGSKEGSIIAADTIAARPDPIMTRTFQTCLRQYACQVCAPVHSWQAAEVRWALHAPGALRAAAHSATAAGQPGCWTARSARPPLTVPTLMRAAACVPVLPGQTGPLLHTCNIILKQAP